MTSIYRQSAAGLVVELEDSFNVVIVSPRLIDDDVRITVPDVEGLVRALRDTVTMRAVHEEIAMSEREEST